MSELRIGVDLGGTKTEAVVVRLAKNRREPDVVARKRVPTAPRADTGDDDAVRYQRILGDTRELVMSVARDAGIYPADLPPIGVGMPGSTTSFAPDGSPSPVPLVKNSNTTCLNGRPFHDDLARAIGRDVVFANDANCFALAEAVWGAARDARVSFGVIMGTGVGGGLVVRDGFGAEGTARAWEGAQGIAGEWGHVTLDPHGGPPCYCGRRGCIETYLSGPAIEAAYAKRAGAKLSLREVSALAEREDKTALSVISERMDLFGRAIATVVNVVDPDVVVLGGGVSNVDALYTDGVAALGRWVFNDVLATRVIKHELGDSAGVLGAALLPG